MTTTTCLPHWHRLLEIANGRPSANIIKSGCGTSDGNVQCSPESMRLKAEKVVGFPVSLADYTLARYVASEVGSGSQETKVAVAEAALNRAKDLPKGVLSLLLYRQKPNHPNYGHYGPIHGPSGVQSAPYGRWAATSRDPTKGDIILAKFVLSGKSNNFSRGADDQMGPEHLNDPVRSVRVHAADRDYWVGLLPGVDHWHTFLYRHLPSIDPTSGLGKTLINRGVAAMEDRGRPDWSGLSVCTSPSSRALATVFGFIGGASISVAMARLLDKHLNLVNV